MNVSGLDLRGKKNLDKKYYFFAEKYFFYEGSKSKNPTFFAQECNIIPRFHSQPHSWTQMIKGSIAAESGILKLKHQMINVSLYR